MKTIWLTAVLLTLVACSEGQDSSVMQADARWYSQAQVDMGRVVFGQNCAACHGYYAQVNSDWKKAMPDAQDPPPALNGTAHAWHHPMKALKRTIDMGGVPLGGKMPAFRDKLNNAEKEAAIAYFQSFWSDEVYTAWLGRGGFKP
ncbi:MAG: cytochrome c [Gammaproteobacteria bacterium]|nr:cytochrome c [Gammaproteobacteria bacterium]